MARQIASEEGIPASFLAKTLQQLARKGLLHSVKGPTGGFGLHRAPDKISLMDIVSVLDGPESFDRCIVGLHRCTDESPCSMDRSFQPIRREIVRYLTKTTVADLANGTGRAKRPTRAEPASKARSRKKRR